MNSNMWNYDNFDEDNEYYDDVSGLDFDNGPRDSGGWQGSGNWQGVKRGGWNGYNQGEGNWGPSGMMVPPQNWGPAGNWGLPAPSQNWGPPGLSQNWSPPGSSQNWGPPGPSQNWGPPGPSRNWGPPGPSRNWGPSGGGKRPGFWGPAQQNLDESEPDFGWGRGFGPDGPPVAAVDVATRHLLRCKVPRQYIKNLPKPLLKLFGPNRCGLCEVTFESFATSRGHYLSKGHYKRQKRCVAQKVNDGFKRPNKKESPLLAREKYCELCNVQITSEAHAVSHYAGRSHRAIVIGNKGPKNEALLRKDMSGRIAQLINREKNFIKTVEEVKKPDDHQEPPPKELSPDLYCEICKTFVTCSEQMRMHLNGKRHLTKEKQHILKMMTVPTGKDKASPDEQKNEDAEAESLTEADDNGDKFDWGNGSEAWEEDQANKQQEKDSIDDPMTEN